jgi:hypothetical protein
MKGSSVRKNVIILFFFIWLLSILEGCSGYHVKRSNNPWQQFGIHHVTIPLFQNDSLLTGINNVITSAVISELQQFSGLEISAGEDHQADALLLGIIHGPNSMNKAITTKERIFLDNRYNQSLGERRGIYLPRQQSYSVQVELILIKHPTTFDRKLLRSKLSKYMRSSKIIFRELLTVSQSITRSLWTRDNVDNGGVVNYTQSRGTLLRSYDVAADEIARQFREMILYAF